MRKLASIQTIRNIKPIEGADKIECLEVLGWQTVAKKGNFQIGQKIVFCEVDSVLPKAEWNKFLHEESKDSIRLKTRKFKGQISQGVAFDLDILPPGNHVVGDDVSDLLGVSIYVPYIPAHLMGKVKGDFVSFLSKTDETRIQSAPDILQRYKDIPFSISEKLDGSSISLFLNRGVFGVCSRNVELLEDGSNAYWKAARAGNIEEKLKQLSEFIPNFPNWAIQGELVGNGIQGNKYKLGEPEIYVFNIYNIDNRKYLDYTDMVEACFKLNLKMVPIINECFYLDGLKMCDMVDMSRGNSKLNKQTIREGIVIRPLVNLFGDPDVGRLSFKVINPDFLLKYNDE
jgi:RNA ligase (TIGR02306 family)